MADFSYTPSITLTVNRCWKCGQFYAVEHTKNRCPYCADADVDAARREEQRAVRSANALRGALKSKRRP